MNWQIDYFNEKVEKAVLKMPTGILARYLHLSDLMLEFGPNLGMPHTRALKEKLFELRIKAKEGIGRVFFCTKIGKRIIILHSFVKKSQRTPEKELKIARKRLIEVLKNET
jgi:phage-related protein